MCFLLFNRHSSKTFTVSQILGYQGKLWSLSQMAFGLEGGLEIREQMAALLSAFMGGSTELEANS